MSIKTLLKKLAYILKDNFCSCLNFINGGNFNYQSTFIIGSQQWIYGHAL